MNVTFTNQGNFSGGRKQENSFFILDDSLYNVFKDVFLLISTQSSKYFLVEFSFENC